MSNRGCTFLTDPWFSQRPSYHPGESAALGVSELSALNEMLISHHYDHCDLKAVRAYRDRGAPILVAAPAAARAWSATVRPPAHRPHLRGIAWRQDTRKAPSSPSGAEPAVRLVHGGSKPLTMAR